MKKFVLSITAGLIGLVSTANNIVVSTATLSGQNVVAHTEVINFNVTWDNSWRTSINESNYDGAWIFVKYRRLSGPADWRHCTLNIAGAVQGAGGGVLTVQNDLKGAFINRAADGIGTVNFTGNQLVWNYGADGVLDNETVEIRVFALEMVYIPTGGYQLGSGGTEAYVFKTGSTSTPYNVTNAPITWGTTGTNLNSNGNGVTTGTLAAAYPTGYNAFWMMKYEATQQQYVDFLNHLDLARATANNTPGIFTGTHPNLVAPQPERAVGTITTQRMAALADWSGLRPYTEMEFEKASRGANIPAIPNEYVWGSTTITNLATVTGLGLSNEAVSTPATANANIASTYNVLTRAGIFARTTGSTRELSGATYYGIMNMGDNTIELCVNAITATGLAFDGSINGDGYLDAAGNTNISNWATATAYGWRGSNFISSAIYARTSDRTQASAYGVDNAYSYVGIRLARTAQ